MNNSRALLRELCERWELKTGIKSSISTMHRRLEKLKLTTKKNSICRGTRNPKNQKNAI